MLVSATLADAPYFQVGWWIADAPAPDASVLPASLQDPFAVSGEQGPEAPRWYLSADDANGYVPLASGSQPYYLTRVYAVRTAQVKMQLAGEEEILPRLWVNGIRHADSSPVTLRQGWNTVVARVENVSPSSNVLYHPRIGFFLFLDRPEK
jgi:hypothetical protein